jgi:hypothetical protein
VENQTFRVEITLVRVEITLCVYKSHSCVSLSYLRTMRVSYSHAYVSKLLSCEWKPHSAKKSHYACENRTLRVEINLVLVEITLVRVGVTVVNVFITIRVEITLCV